MNAFIVVVSATLAALNVEFSFATKAEAKVKQVVLIAGFVTDGYVADSFDGDVLFKGDNFVSVDIDEVNEDSGPFLSEYEQGWANIRAENRAIVERQNREDAEYARRRQSVPSYNGVRGSYEPDGGVIYEPR